MKNFVLLVVAAVSLLTWALAHADSLTLRNGTTWANCDQVFAPEPLRYGYAYRFYDRFNNASSQTAYIWNQSFAIEGGNFLSQGQAHPTGNLMDFSAVLAANNYAVASGTSMEVVNTFTADWGIINRPASRSSGAGDIGFQYNIGYDFDNSGNPAGIRSHVECQPYYITWCGDGVLDSGFEQCDGTAGVGAGQTCNASCQIVNNPAPTCNGLTATPIFSVAPTSVAISCATSNATTVAIDCGNGQTINAANGTCNYATGWFYTATCTVNGTITNAACSAGVQVDNARFDLSLKKFVNGQDAQTPATAVAVVGGSTATYTFVVTNNGPVPVSNVTTVTDSTLGGNLVLQGVPSGSGWTCTIEGTGFRCTRLDTLAVGASFPTITAQVVVTNTAGTYANTAAVSNPSENPANNFGNNNIDPAHVSVAVVNPTADFDLSLKKFVNGQDAQTAATAVAAAQNSQVTYTFVARNNGLAAVSGTTTISDTSFGGFVTPASVPTGPGWTCALVGLAGSSGFTCTTTATVAVNTDFPTITLTANVGVLNGVFPNLASVSNPNENPLNNFGNNNTDPANITAGSATLFNLLLKKYVNSVSAATDAQTAAIAVTIAPSTAYNYVLQVTNSPTSTSAVTGTTTVTDPGPAAGVTLVGTPTGTGWTCIRVALGFSCTTTATPAIGANFPDITAPATTSATNGTFLNTATVSNPGDTLLGDNSDPANVAVGVVTPGLFDLSLKKYINSVAQDAQDGAPEDIAVSTAFTYLIRVTNTATSAGAVTGTTTVTDPGPAAGVTLVGTPTGTGWTCIRVALGFSCTTTATPAIGANFPDILASATTTAATGTFRNLATVANPGDTILTNNTDPANVRVSTSGGSGPGTCESLTAVQVSGTNTVGFAMQCTPSIAAGGSPTIEIRCGNGQIINGATGTCLFNSSAGSPYQAECYVNNSTNGGPNTGCRRQLTVNGGTSLPVGSYCGDGIIDQGIRTLTVAAPLGTGWTCTTNMNPAIPATGTTPAIPATIRDYTCTTTVAEQCDAGNIGGVNISNALCNASCQINTTSTRPGACVRGVLDCPGTSTNPVGNPLSIEFDPSAAGRATQSVMAARWIIGNGVPVFDAGDRFLLSSPFPTILQGATMAISNNNSPLIQGTFVNRTFGSECIGAGSIDFGAGPQACSNAIAVFTAGAGGAINGVTFRGDATSITAGSSADVNPPLSAGSAIRQANFAISLGYLVEGIPVRVSKPAVSTTAGGSAFVASTQTVGNDVNTITAGFIDDLRRGNFTVSAASTVNSATTAASSTSVGLSTSGVTTPSSVVTVTTAAGINHTNFAKVGDAPNIYLMANGVVKLGSPTTPLILSGIGTIVIEKGTLEILGDIEYADANASWAFIIKEPAADGVAIRVNSSVQKIAGAYLALSGRATGANSVTPLAIDGNMNADIGELVTNRTYIRGVENSTALSTGVTINYSTRALKNPPPLLTQYLEQYNLDRVSR